MGLTTLHINGRVLSFRPPNNHSINSVTPASQSSPINSRHKLTNLKSKQRMIVTVLPNFGYWSEFIMALTSCFEKCTITCSSGDFAAMIQLAPGFAVLYFVDIPAVFSFTGNGIIIRCGEIRTILTPDFATVTSTLVMDCSYKVVIIPN